MQRGRERLFHASLSVTLHAADQDTLKDLTQEGPGPLRRHAGQAGQPGLPPKGGTAFDIAPGAERRDGVRTLDTSSLARLFPSRRRTWTLAAEPSTASTCGPAPPSSMTPSMGRTSTPTPPSWQGPAAASPSPPSWASCGGCAGGCGPTSSIPRASTPTWPGRQVGRVLSPGVPGQGMNPFVIDRGDSEELLQRIGSLRRLIEVMVGERLSAERRSSLDHALAGLLLRKAGAHGVPRLLHLPARGDAGDRPPAAALRHRQPAGPALRRGRRPAGPVRPW